MRVTPLFLDSDPDSRFDIGVFGDAEYPHPPLPYSKQDAALVFMGDYLYLIGGYDASRRDLDHIYGKYVDRLDLTQVR